MKNLHLAFLILACFALRFSYAQYDESKIDPRAVTLYRAAMQAADIGQYTTSIKVLEEALKSDSNYVDAWLSLAGLYGQLKDYNKSASTYEKAFRLDTNYTSGYRLPYSINLAGAGDFQKALASVESLLLRDDLADRTRKAAEYRRRSYRFAVDFAKAHAADNYVFAPRNLGDGINTAESEYFPSLPIDGTELLFTRKLNFTNEDFFSSQKTANGWDKAVHLNGSINTAQNEGALNISQDGKWLVFTGCERPGGFGSCDLYISYLTNSGWSEALNLGGTINTDQWESQPSLSPDKRQLYFASRRFGGFGGSDIYVTHLLPNGRWSEPENLGPTVNTPGDEASPFIHADNQTLYFTSNGLQGYGEEDIFMIRKDSAGNWGKPQNLGYPINTIDHEGTLFIAADGKTAYFASDRSDSRGGLDIYSFEMRPDIRPNKTLWIRGKVFDKITAAGLPSTVELIDLAGGQIISRVQTDEGGNYLITLPVGKDYAFNVNRRGYLFYSDNFLLKNKAPDSTYEKNIPLQPIEVNASVVLRNIFFDFNRSELKPESVVELDKLAQFLKDNPTVAIQIEGHTDNIGKPADNLKLSQSRANAVVKYLVSKGISVTRLTGKGFGETKPVAPNKTEEGRAMNRRTEVKVVRK